MRWIPRSLCLALLGGVGSGCHSANTAPEGALIGRFGAGVAEVDAKASSIYVRLRCDTFDAKGPLVPDADGRFAIELTPRPGNESRIGTLQGVVDGNVIRANATIVFPTFVRTAQVDVVRGGKPNYDNLSCHVP